MRRTGRGYVRIIDFVFYNEKAIRAEILDARQDEGIIGRNGSGVGDPTATRAIKNVMPIKAVTVKGTRVAWPESWIKVIESTRRWAAWDKFRERALKDMYSNVDYRQTCLDLAISTATLQRLRQEIRQRAALCAANLNLIRFV